MSLTRTAVRTRVRTLIAEPSAKAITDAEINSWIDDACRDISIRTLCNEEVCTAMVTVSGTRAYDVPVTLNTSAIETIAVKTILNSANQSLLYTTADNIGRHGGEGKNMQWTEWGSSMIVSPTPSAAYTLEPLVWIIIGCTAAGTLAIDSKYHHVVATHCLFSALLKKREYEAAAAAFKLYVEQLAPDRPPDTKVTEANQSPQD
jgi:hypothetical protein